MKIARRLAAVASGIAVTAILTGCSMASTAPDEMALHYKAGPMSSTKFANCVSTGTRNVDGPSDKHFYYPVNQRAWDARGLKGSDSKPVTVVSNDNAEMSWPATVTFTLTNDCEKLRLFHERIGNRYAAFDDEGWVRMLNFVFGVPFDTTLDRIAQQYNWRDLWNEPAVKTKIEQEIEKILTQRVTEQAGGPFFRIDTVQLLKPEPTDRKLVDAIQNEQASVAKAKSAEAEAKARKASAEAQIAVEKAEAAKIRERIKVIGVDGWLKEQAIGEGLNPWQPVIVPGMPQAQ